MNQLRIYKHSKFLSFSNLQTPIPIRKFTYSLPIRKRFVIRKPHISLYSHLAEKIKKAIHPKIEKITLFPVKLPKVKQFHQGVKPL